MSELNIITTPYMEAGPNSSRDWIETPYKQGLTLFM